MTLKKQLIISVLFLCVMAVVQAQQRRSNPIVSHMFTADPSAHVWEDGRLYVYPSTDVAPPRGYKTMDGYHVFSTDDMITWTDHGQILHSDEVAWGREEGGFMWAPDCAYKNGTYYFYFPHRSGNGRDTWKIGVATSSSPTSGFKDQGYIKGLKSLIDPCVFTDDDGQSYLFIGGEGDPTGYKLKENMMEIDGEPHSIEGLDGFREGLWIFKRKGIYYIIYPDNFPKYNKMRYAMSEHIYGPYECKGVFVDSTDVITMHGSVVEYKDQWYVFYHNGSLSGGIATNRSICFDPVYFNEDGTIQMVKKTLGVKLPTFHNAIHYNEMFGTLEPGEYRSKDLKKKGIKPNAISSIQIPKAYVVEAYEKDNFKGKSWTFAYDYINLEEIGANDVISSIKVRRSQQNNLLKNPDFALATQGQIKHWGKRGTLPFEQCVDPTAVAYYALKYSGNKPGVELSQQVQLKQNTAYQLSVRMKVEGGTKGQAIVDTKGLFDGQVSFRLSADKSKGQWIEFSGEFNSGDATQVPLRCATSKDFDGTCYWDNVVLMEK